MIKNAITYHVEMPTSSFDMYQFMADEFLATKPTAMQLESFGFAKHPITGNLVSDFEGGYCLTFMQYKKKLDMNAVRYEVNSLVKEYKALQGREITKKEKSEIKDGLISNQLPHILPTPKLIFAYYDIKSKTPLVDTTQDSISDLCTSLLRKAIGSLKATTLYIDNRTGLTAKLAEHLGADSNFQFTDFIPGIYLGNSLELNGGDKEKFILKNKDLLDEGTAAEIVDNINDTGMYVKSLEMVTANGDLFTLTDGFKFKGFSFDFDYIPEYSDDDTPINNWQADTFYAMTQIVNITTKVCDAFTVIADE